MAENMIKFLRGNVASLPQTATAGAVYFTKDEGLYLGLEDGSYHRYGDFITVANVDALPSTGAHETCMYYCEYENILAKWDGAEWVQINKQKTLEQLGGVAKSVYDAKMAALEKADTDNATAISNLSTYVGTIPNGEDGNAIATSVIAYINKKTDGIATAGNLEALGARVTTAESDIDKLEAALAEGGDTAKAIAEAKAAADKAQSDVDALSGKVGTVAEGKTVVGLIDDAQKQANKGVADAAAAQAKADSAYTLAEGKATMSEVNTAIANAGHAVKAEVDQAFADMETAYKAADTALESKLQANIDKKVDQTAYDTKMTALGNEDTRLAGLISDMDTAYKAADSALDKRVAELESDITGLSGAMHFKGVVEELPATTEGYVDGDTIIVGNKEYVVNGENFVELGDVSSEVQRISDLEAIVNGTGEGEAHVDGLVDKVADNAAAIVAEKERAEAKEAELVQADIDNLAAAKKYTDDEITELNIAQYAKQSDLDTHTTDKVVHITAAERTAWNAAEQNAKDYADGLKNTIDAAYAAADATLKTEIVGTENDASSVDTIKGAKKYADEKATAAKAAAESTAASALATARTEISAEIDADVKALADGQVAANKTAIEVLNGNATTEGSVAKALADAKAYADTAESDAVTAANAYTDSALTWGSF